MIDAKTLEEQASIDWIPVREIGIDREYQRPLSPSKVKDIATKFSKNAVGTLMVSLRENKRFYVMDGQHRLEAMKKVGVVLAECKIIEGLSQAEEADIFIKCNANTKRPEALDLFRARLIRQEPTVIAIQNVVEKCGLSIQFSPEGGHPGKKRSPTAVWAVTALEDIYKRGREKLLEDVLKLAMRSWPDDGDAFQSKVLLGIADFHLKYQGQYIREDFIAKMNITALKSLLRRAQYHSENGGGAFPKTFSLALQEAYDSGKRTRRLKSK